MNTMYNLSGYLLCLIIFSLIKSVILLLNECHTFIPDG